MTDNLRIVEAFLWGNIWANDSQKVGASTVWLYYDLVQNIYTAKLWQTAQRFLKTFSPFPASPATFFFGGMFIIWK